MSPLSQRMWNQFNKLFSIAMVIDRDLNIVLTSKTLRRHMPGIENAPHLNEVFEIRRPARIEQLEDIVAHLNSLFLLEAKNRKFAIRGQMTIESSREGEDYACFLGSPWLSWMLSNSPEVKLGINDFSAQDVQLDQLFYMSTEKRMVEDLERLNQQLHSANEEVELAQAEKNAFFAQMSHEMRTPLNGVVAALALMREHNLPEQTAQLLEMARESSRNLMQVINYVLDVAKIESMDGQQEQVQFNPVRMIDSIIDIVRPRAMEKGLALHCRIDDDIPPAYLGNADHLRQALLNLATNAIKFTERGSVTIHLTPAASRDCNLRVEVIDTGIGISKQDQSAIFDPFVSLNRGDATSQQPGTGLGLDIARRNVNSMGGKIGLSSAPGVGATFWIELPLTPVATAESVPDLVESRPESGFSGDVLLVDDNETNLMLGGMILEGMGIHVVPAISGEAAVEIVNERQLDLVLMDISMPGIDGFEATRQIRRTRDADELPVIALTAYASSVERAKSRECGMNDYLTKPVEREQLAATLSRWLPQSENRQADRGNQDETDQDSAELDQAVLEKLEQQIGIDNLLTVINKFCDEAQRRWKALESATSDPDRAREAHTLASTCRSFGLPAVADKLNCIEAHAKARGDAPEPPCIQETGRQLSRGLVLLKARVEEMSLVT